MPDKICPGWWPPVWETASNWMASGVLISPTVRRIVSPDIRDGKPFMREFARGHWQSDKETAIQFESRRSPGAAVPPHPNPLPRGEGESSAAARRISIRWNCQNRALGLPPPRALHYPQLPANCRPIPKGFNHPAQVLRGTSYPGLSSQWFSSTLKELYHLLRS